MEHFFHRMHVRRESLKKQTMTRLDQWRDDETHVRHGPCDFLVKYLGYTEILESKGTEICKQSFHKLKYDELGYSLAQVFHKNKRRVSTTSHHYATLQISSERVRIIDENDDILVDTPIASISFCCPNSHHERGFTYICRGDVPWKWHCHAVEAVDDLGERLNHAVGCAFSMNLQQKMLNKRQNSDPDRKIEDGATPDSTPGAPSANFRKLTITDRQIDPQASLVASAVPRRCSESTAFSSVDRPRAPVELKERKGSLGVLIEAHPYKRQIPERVTEEEVELRNSSDPSEG